MHAHTPTRQLATVYWHTTSTALWNQMQHGDNMRNPLHVNGQRIDMPAADCNTDGLALGIQGRCKAMLPCIFLPFCIWFLHAPKLTSSLDHVSQLW